MSPRAWRRVRRWLVLPACALAAMLLVAAAFSGHFLTHPPRASAAATPAAYGLEHEEWRLTTADGVSVAAWWVPQEATPPGTQPRAILFLHGYADSKAQVLPMLRWLHPHAGVLAPDLRAHGQSGGSFTTAGHLEVAEAVAAATALREAGYRNVTLLGWSMGGATALNAAAAIEPILHVEAVVTDSAFARLADTNAPTGGVPWLPSWPMRPLAFAFAAFETGLDLEDNEPVRHAARLQAPLLVLHGAQDTLVEPWHARELVAAAPDARLVEFDAGHVGLRAADPEAYSAAVLDFLRAAWEP